MTTYHAPVAELEFLLGRVLDLRGLLALPAFADIDPDIVAGVLREGARYVEQVLSPTNAPGDAIGARLVDGRVGLRLIVRVVSWTLAMLGLATFAGLFPQLFAGTAQAGMGGTFGDLLLPALAAELDSFGVPTPATVGAIASGVVGLMLYVLALGMNPLKLTLPALPWDAIGASIGGAFVALGRGLTSPFRAFRGTRVRIARRASWGVSPSYVKTPISVPAAALTWAVSSCSSASWSWASALVGKRYSARLAGSDRIVLRTGAL